MQILLTGNKSDNDREKRVSTYSPDFPNVVGVPTSSQMAFQKEKVERTSIMNNYLDIPAQDTFHRIPTHLEHNRFEATISRTSPRATIKKSKESAHAKPEQNLPIDQAAFYNMNKDKSEPRITQKLSISKLLFDQNN